MFLMHGVTIPRIPAEEFDGKVFAMLMIVGIMLIFAGYVGYRSRNLMEAE